MLKDGFTDELNRAFLQSNRFISLKGLRRVFVVFALLYGLFAITDVYFYPDTYTLWWILRFTVVIPVIIAIVIFSFHERFPRYHQQLIAAAFFVGGAVISAMLVVDPNNSIYYGGLLMVNFSGYLLVRLRFFYALVAGWSVLLLHTVGILVYHGYFPEAFLFSALFLIGANVIGMVGAFNIERANREQFLKDHEIHIANNTLQRQNKEITNHIAQLESFINKNKELRFRYNEKEQLMKQLEVVQERFEAIAKQSRTFFYELNPDGLYTYVSSSVEIILGYTVDEIENTLYFYDLFPDAMREKYKKRGFEGLEKGEIVNGFVNPLETKSGEIIWVTSYLSPVRDEEGNITAYRGSDKDITSEEQVKAELIKTQDQLKASKDQLQLVMDNLPIGIAVNTVHPSARFSYVNENFLRIYDIKREDLDTGDGYWNAVYEDPAFREKIKKRVEEDVASGDPTRMHWQDVPIKRKGKPTRYITAQNTPVPGADTYISTVIDVTERKAKEDEIRHISNHDYLTNLPNRRYFQDILAEYDSEAHYPLGIAIMDLNGLKLINDAFGHSAGNLALKRIAKVLRKAKRKQDFIARIGGDEFAMLCPKTDDETMAKLARRLDLAIEKEAIQNITLSMAIGYFVKDQAKQKLRTVLSNAENNMYKNKVLSSHSLKNDAIASILETLQEKFVEEKVHSERVSRYCKRIGEALNLREEEIKELEYAGLYHDIGKISIPDAILDKPGKLTPKEWTVMRNHTLNGYQILRAADRYSNIAEYAMSHHERIDGKGYPNGIKGDDIPLFSRIICVADAYEAMTSDRPYRKAMQKTEAIKELQAHAGTQFDEHIVAVFIKQVIADEPSP